MSDPTQSLREEFLQEIRRRFENLWELIEHWVGEEDIFGLRTDSEAPTTKADVPDGAPEVYRFQTDPQMVGSFLEWLGEQVGEEILEPVAVRNVRNGEHWTGVYLRHAYSQAWQEARARLRTRGLGVGPQMDVEEILQLPAAERDLRRLYTRTYENLQSVSADVADPVRDTLTEGFAKGQNPRDIARELDKEIQDIRATRAETLARTEVVNAYSESTISRYKRADVGAVQHGEWSDADDGRVCPVCESLDGREIPLTTIDEATFTYEPDEDEPDSLAGEYALKPPAHPNGRCVLLPVIG